MCDDVKNTKNDIIGEYSKYINDLTREEIRSGIKLELNVRLHYISYKVKGKILYEIMRKLYPVAKRGK
jgi:hypothetical protein